MKTLILSCSAIAALLSLSSCTTVLETPTAAPETTTTTTQKSTVPYPLGGTTETKTTRTY
jgi:outer membrane protein assembly factor BamE (lipoprotein component of BamABCDE complex)